jgi:cell division transport system permease protein
VRWRFFFGEALRSLRGNVATTLAAAITVLFVTLLLGAFATGYLLVRDQTQQVRDDVTVKAYLAKGTERDINTLNKVHNELMGLPYVKTIKYVSPDAAIETLSDPEKKQLQVLNYNPLPPSFWITLTNADKVQQVAADAAKVPEVQQCGQPPCVTYGAKTAKRVLFVTKVLTWIAAGAMVLLGVAAVVLIANTIRLSIFARSREIEVMKLVGASNVFVRVPFMLEGMLTGLVGALCAIGALAVGYWALDAAGRDMGFLSSTFPGGLFMFAVMLAAFGVFLGAFGSGLMMRKFLRV